MLKKILSISGRRGLFRLISQTKSMTIVESLTDKKRLPIYNKEKTVSLGDIAIYTKENDVRLHIVLASMRDKENGEICSLDLASATNSNLLAYMEELMPDFDRDRVYATDIRKLILWYNALTEAGISDFSPEKTEEAETEKEE